MALSLKHSVQTANVIIVSRDGQGVGYTVPVDLVLFLLWFLSSATAQFLAVMGMAGFACVRAACISPDRSDKSGASAVKLRQGWQWLTDWSAWLDGVLDIADEVKERLMGFLIGEVGYAMG